jgi:hypothetical protein
MFKPTARLGRQHPELATAREVLSRLFEGHQPLTANTLVTDK